MRRAILLAIPVLVLALMIQTAIISRMTLLNGSADIIMLILAAWALQERVRSAWIWGAAAGLLVGSVSGVPWYIYFIGYLVVVAFARLLTRRIWQAPLLAMFTVTFTGTILILMLTFVQRSLFEVPLVFGDVFTQIVLPSLLLNLMLAIPIRSLIQSLAESIYPAEGLA